MIIDLSDILVFLNTVQAIEKNTKKTKKSKFMYCLTVCYQILGIMGVGIALTLSCTMIYILWIGFYPPGTVRQIFFAFLLGTASEYPTFIDRLNDLKELIEGFRNGSIQESFVKSFIHAFEITFKETWNPSIPSLPYTP